MSWSRREGVTLGTGMFAGQPMLEGHGMQMLQVGTVMVGRGELGFMQISNSIILCEATCWSVEWVELQQGASSAVFLVHVSVDAVLPKVCCENMFA